MISSLLFSRAKRAALRSNSAILLWGSSSGSGLKLSILYLRPAWRFFILPLPVPKNYAKNPKKNMKQNQSAKIIINRAQMWQSSRGRLVFPSLVCIVVAKIRPKVPDFAIKQKKPA
jgi:hypothetical protein